MKTLCRPLVMENRHGLHMRPAAEIARIAAQYDSEIHLSKAEGRADVRSIFELMILGVGHGDALVLHAAGHDAQEALDAIGSFLDSYRDVDVDRKPAGIGEPDKRVA